MMDFLSASCNCEVAAQTRFHNNYNYFSKYLVLLLISSDVISSHAFSVLKLEDSCIESENDFLNYDVGLHRRCEARPEGSRRQRLRPLLCPYGIAVEQPK